MAMAARDGSSRTKNVGTVEIDVELCKGCELCVPACPEHVLAMIPELNHKGWPVVALVEPGCTGCTICARVCPDGVFTVFRERERKSPAT
jgi:2-oxoglutarate ferredoxin oxidoreductase subunit delta